MAYKSAYKAIAASLRTALARTGVNTGGTAAYPRVELHSWIENEPMDKGATIRTLTCTMESISTASPDAAYTMNADNLAVLSDWTYTGSDFNVFGIVPRQMQDMQEVGENATYYRLLQTIEIFIQQL